MLEIKQIEQYYGSSHTLRSVSMDVRSGECMALLGRNGVGKTTLLKCLMGVLPIARGQILLDGTDITRLAPHQRAGLGMAYVPQGRDIFARLSVEENILMGMARFPAAKARRIREDVYELFPVLQTMLARRGGDLSGGQQQQLAIARALVSEPRFIIFDEPTEGIQPSIIKDIGRVIQLLKQRGNIAILLCEQYFDFAHELADRFVVLNRGEVAAHGSHTEMGSEDVRMLLAV
ncbi:urea ABC transporter ATP-binding subunit UrtE [Kerstersia gyiorum]|jgi:urea transport system ATP-binding protein|uniref:Amino acid/amide ABC transporter ATP-binding protein 2 (HAAT family) n=1 Tax=Kerstersia gyiorum TaxID=206506 RepID=A0A171KVF7_9BURK|nr:urea ABC transporter ATP-binding subunit UrtE [Kerstersia gyiorum]KAB0542712.1 urea ABC transporter ATP-binding subunit UrtE [Kerstersia gyiorum]KKO72874.1 urea ABC transporter ATP-binding protein [Kerstersia gyiorum]MCH4271319.1 urea ABC transporter ATP-binding subunit UrtE [Kerstersia gyiorum]MCI1229171.1 urea ABC transporter ATP-binding subunit UrtE [Kerstersia gyiorum]MCP1633793.1 urea transport system ATP-binding protein [Kerstersia gyiorum]